MYKNMSEYLIIHVSSITTSRASAFAFKCITGWKSYFGTSGISATTEEASSIHS